MMEMFSGIPVKALLENDEKTTKLDLGYSGCGDTEALVLAECLKVVELFVFLGMFRVFSVFLVTVPLVLFVQINNTVTDLNLRYNKFGDAGAIAISEALKVSFVFFRERSPFSWLPPPVTHLF